MKSEKREASLCSEKRDTLLIKSISEEVIVKAITEHPEVFASLVADALNEAETRTGVDYCGDPVDLLPKSLRRQLRHRKAFRRAFSKKLITVVDGELTSQFGSVSKLSYFCGRCFCGDEVEVKCHKHFIKKSGRKFPARELEEFFGVRNLRYSRKNLIKSKIPACYQFIDNLFDE